MVPSVIAHGGPDSPVNSVDGDRFLESVYLLFCSGGDSATGGVVGLPLFAVTGRIALPQ
jgi:hypothetical protein